MFAWIYFIAKYAIIGILLYFVHLVYQFVVSPWFTRRKYAKYSNVSMTKKYYPLLGDIAIMQQAERENKFRMQYYIDAALERTDVDLVLTQVGNHIEIDPVSVKALGEFESLVPSKIDRYSSESMPVQRICRDSFGMIVSNSSWSDRRKTILKIIGINFASQYITMMIKAVDDWTEKLKLNEEVNFSIELNKLAFCIISKILFGRDIEKADKLEYISSKDGSSELMSFQDFFLKYAREEFESYVSPKGRLFPFLVTYRLAEPYKTNAKNNMTLYSFIKVFLAKSEDDESVYKQVLNLGKFSHDEIIADMMMMLFGGYDTTSHLVTSVIYCVYKHPEVHRKLMDSLRSSGIIDLNPESGAELKDLYENCEYLNFVIKEGLRFDSPAPGGLSYSVKEDIVLCGVPISRGTILRPFPYFSHYNKDQFFNPNEFVPERFDPESEYFRPINPKSFVPFSFGARNCAGQTLAKLESKVLISRILSTMKLKINQLLLDNQYAKFNMMSQMSLMAEVVSKSKQ